MYDAPFFCSIYQSFLSLFLSFIFVHLFLFRLDYFSVYLSFFLPHVRSYLPIKKRSKFLVSWMSASLILQTFSFFDDVILNLMFFRHLLMWSFSGKFTVMLVKTKTILLLVVLVTSLKKCQIVSSGAFIQLGYSELK